MNRRDESIHCYVLETRYFLRVDVSKFGKLGMKHLTLEG